MGRSVSRTYEPSNTKCFSRIFRNNRGALENLNLKVRGQFSRYRAMTTPDTMSALHGRDARRVRVIHRGRVPQAKSRPISIGGRSRARCRARMVRHRKHDRHGPSVLWGPASERRSTWDPWLAARRYAAPEYEMYNAFVRRRDQRSTFFFP